MTVPCFSSQPSAVFLLSSVLMHWRGHLEVAALIWAAPANQPLCFASSCSRVLL